MAAGVVHRHVHRWRIVASVDDDRGAFGDGALQPVTKGAEPEEELGDHHRTAIHVERADHLCGVFLGELRQEHLNAVLLGTGRGREFVHHHQSALARLLRQ
jgi:hypothetical protein